MRLEDFQMDQASTIVDALERLDQTGRNCVFVVDEEGKLVASLTDGDVRRYILTHGSIQGTVSDASCHNPRFVNAAEKPLAFEIARTNRLTAVPVVDDAKRIVEIVFSDSVELLKDSKLDDPLPVVMMAGGKGTRLMPYTMILPKPLIPVNGKTIAERIMERFYEGGCTDFYLVLNYKKGMIKAYFDELQPEYAVHYVDEPEFLGTGGGVKLVEGAIDGTFILTNCDILVDVNLGDLHRVHKTLDNAVTVVCSLKNYTIPYGTIEIGEGGQIEGMTEKPTIPSLINTGCYMVEPCVFELIKDNESVGFPDVITRCQAAGLNVGIFPVSEGGWLDMGQPEELKRMMDVLGEPAGGE